MLRRVFVGILCLGFVAGALVLLLKRNEDVKTYKIAFIGNSFQFANDLPRFMEALAAGAHVNGGGDRSKIQIEQDSCLHGSLSFVSLLKYGNGMYNRWRRPNALLDGYTNDTDDALYDYGACTVRQLLLGYDESLEYISGMDDDNYGADDDGWYFEYRVDGKNPCFEDSNYLAYTLTEKVQSLGNSTPQWDYIVLNDQSMRPARAKSQASSLQVLLDTYVDMILATGDAIPVFFATYGYWRPDLDEEMTADFVDVPTFTLMLYEGYLNYAEELEALLPSHQRPRIAPVGFAFLVIWEENHALWERLFGEDYFHPSPLGTYLIGCVLYMTMFDHQPSFSSDHFNAAALWEHARNMQVSGDDLPLPTEDEALYLRWVANRVTRQGYIPESLASLMLALTNTTEVESTARTMRYSG